MAGGTVPLGQAPAGKVPMNINGEVRYVDASKVARAKRELSEFSSSEELASEQKKKRAEGLGASAFALGALDTATLGLSTKALQMGAPMFGATEAEVSEAMGGIRDTHEGAYITGQIGGAFIPGTAGALAGKVGGAVAKGVGGVLGAEAATLGGRVLQGAAKYGAAGAAEGAMFGAGQAVSESAFQNKELTAEHLFAGAGSGALLGGALGAGISGISILGRAGNEKIRDILTKRGAARESAIETERALVAQTTTRLDALEAQIAGGASANAESQAATAGRSRARVEGEQSVKATIEIGRPPPRFNDPDKSMEAFRSFNPSAKDLKAITADTTNAAKNSERMREIGALAREHGLIAAEGGLTAEEVAAKANELRGRVGKLKGNLMEVAEAAGAKPVIGNVTTRIQKEIIEPLSKTLTRKGEADAAFKWSKGIFDTLGDEPTLAKMWEMRQELDGLIKARAWNQVGSPSEEAIKGVRKIVEGEIKRSVEAVGMGDAYTAVNKAYRDHAALADVANNAAKREATRRGGLKLEVESLQAGSIESVLVNAAGSAVGAAANAFSFGMLGAIAKEQTVQALTERALALQRAQRLSGGVAARTENAVAKFIKSAPKIGAAVTSAVRPAVRVSVTRIGSQEPRKVATREEYEQTRDALATYTSNPDALTSALEQQTASLSRVAPEVGASYAMTATRAVMFLQSKAPPSMQDPYSLTPLAKRPMSKTLNTDELRFMRYVAAVKNPESVISDLGQGRINRQGVEALREVFPNYYGEIRKSVYESIADRDPRDPLPYQKALQLGILLDIPTTRYLSREFVSAMQEREQESDGAPADAPAKPRLSMAKLDMNSDSVNSPTDSLEAR